MATRLELHNKLIELLGNNHVYYQPPENLKIEYPAIIYHKATIVKTFANDHTYRMQERYELIVVDRKPDNPVIKKILELPTSSYDRNYRSDNINHDVITIYY